MNEQEQEFKSVSMSLEEIDEHLGALMALDDLGMLSADTVYIYFYRALLQLRAHILATDTDRAKEHFCSGYAAGNLSGEVELQHGMEKAWEEYRHMYVEKPTAQEKGKGIVAREIEKAKADGVSLHPTLNPLARPLTKQEPRR